MSRDTFQWSVLRDPQLFPDPSRFDPTRFLDPSTGGFVMPKGYVAFGVGKRECLGRSLAKIEQFLFTAALVHQFR